MRLIILLSCLPVFLFGQDFKANSFEEGSFLQKRKFSIGLLVQHDVKPIRAYDWKSSDYLPKLQRKALVGLAIEGLPFRWHSYIRLQARISYDKIQHRGDNVAIGDNRFGAGFEEFITFDHWQASLGFQFEAYPKATVSPFIGTHFLLAFPSNLTYDYFRPATTNPGLPLQVRIRKGGRPSPGWEVNTGLRIALAKHWAINLGLYYSDLNILINWPKINGRNFISDTLMTQKNVGFLLAGKYQW